MEIKIPDELAVEVAAVAEKRGLTTDALIAEMVSEALKMHRVPGILFADGATGRRARIAGTGIEVFEVIYAYEAFNRDRNRVIQDLPQLDAYQIDAAIAYYETYPEDILPRLETDEQIQAKLEALWARIPQASPHWPGRQRAVAGVVSGSDSTATE